ncbi:MAG: hypothetical protein C0594_01650 [Marinilabiliales bacterium]|nr:MAG: hypothetical protein C0594_01650 [Marinilabiliales bacterium]
MDKGVNYSIEYDVNGKVIDITDDLIKFLQCTPRDLIGKHHSEIIYSAVSSTSGYKTFWEDLQAGKTRDESNTLKMHGKEIKIFETYIPKRNNKGFVSKIISYLDIFVKKEDNRFEMMQNAETDIITKNTLKKNYISINEKQSELNKKMQAMKERNAKRMQELNDAFGATIDSVKHFNTPDKNQE